LTENAGRRRRRRRLRKRVSEDYTDEGEGVQGITSMSGNVHGEEEREPWRRKGDLGNEMLSILGTWISDYTSDEARWLLCLHFNTWKAFWMSGEEVSGSEMEDEGGEENEEEVELGAMD